MSNNARKQNNYVKRKGNKKQILKFPLDYTHPVEDGIIDAANFELFHQERIKVDRKTANIGGKIRAMEWCKNKTTGISEVPFSKRYLESLTKKQKRKNNLCDWLHTVINNNESYKLCYFWINEDEEKEEDEYGSSLICNILYELLNKAWEPKLKGCIVFFPPET